MVDSLILIQLSTKVIPRNEYTLGSGCAYGRLTPTTALNHQWLSAVETRTRLIGTFFINYQLTLLLA